MKRIGNLTRRRALGAVAAAATTLVLPARAQQQFPHGPVRIIVPVSPGGAADLSARAVAHEMEKSIKQRVYVENKAGGLYQIGVQSLLTAPPDGHTILHLHNSLASAQVVHKLYDLNRNMVPLTLNMETPMVILLPGNSPFNSLKELVTYGRANPGTINYSSLGPGSVEHLKSAQLERAAGFKGVMVAYKGGPEALNGLIGGEVHFTLTAAIWGMNNAPKGLVKIVAVLDTERWSRLPDVPTVVEQGIDLPPLRFWGGFAIHAETPAPIVQRLHRELVNANSVPAVADRLAAGGMTAAVSRSPEEFRQFIEGEVAWMSQIAKDINLKV
jgi:tripartite-type tricarboxylate transporter receptor subunit TctC